VTGPDSDARQSSPYDIAGPNTSLSDQQYRDLMGGIDNSINNPPNYILPGSWWPENDGTNCTGWAADTWNKAGLPPLFGVSNDWVWNPFGQALNLVLSKAISALFTAATAAVAPILRDPLILDLDSDGFETVGIDTTAPILFDHDGDGVKTATGWVAGDDAFLVLDRNGNGTIDDGHELFGDATPLAAGGMADDGFAALAQEDSNNDGQVDALDAHFADLRIWRDLNQDGISQSDELLTLASQGIVSLSTAKTTNSTLLANGNQIADLGGFVRSDGTSGTLGAVEQLADVNLASDPFYSEFTDTIPLTEQVQALPDMQGSGMVRSLREAASLQTAEGNALGSLLAAFAAATTRSDQMALLDGLLKAWADTSTLSTTADSALAGVNLTLSFAGVTSGSAAWQTWVDKLSILECFNGQTFMPVPAAGTTLSIDFFSTRETLLDAAYTALRDSVYGSLVMQTRLKPYMDEIQLVLTEDAVSFDFSQLNALLAGKRDDDPYAATQDFADLVKFGDATLAEMGWSGTEDLVRWANELSSVIDVNAALREVGLAIASGSYTGTDERDVQFGSSGANSMSAGLGDDVLAGLAGNDTLKGGSGNDFIDGGDGNDTINGDSGDDQIFGSTGNDTINGDAGNDVLSGDDAPRISITVRARGTLAGDVGPQMELWLDGVKLASTEVRASDYTDYTFDVDMPDGALDRLDIVFANDAVIAGQDRNLFIESVSAAGQTFLPNGSGVTYDKGNGSSAFDGLNVIAGQSTMAWGGALRFTLSTPIKGSGGTDSLYGGDGNDTLDGGAGSDYLDGGVGSDTFIVRRGSGIDSIYAYDSSSGRVDTLQFEDVASTDAFTLSNSGTDLTVTYATGDAVTIKSHFTSSNHQINQFAFSDRSLSASELLATFALQLTASADSKSFDSAVQNIFAGDGNDFVSAGGGNDNVHGGAGNDTLKGDAGNDQVIGDLGNDSLYGGDGNDTLDGGAGSDYLDGGVGSDTFIVRRGSGIDSIYAYDSSSGRVDTLQFEDVASTDAFTLSNSGTDLTVTYATGDAVTIKSHFTSSNHQINQFAFSDRSLSASELLATFALQLTASADSKSFDSAVQNIFAGDGNDSVSAGGGNDNVHGGAGNDTLKGDAGNDILDGGDGDDVLTDTSGAALFNGGAGNDSLSGGSAAEIYLGGTGNDTLTTGAGNDVLLFNKGDGLDTLAAGASGQDTLSLGGSASYSEFTFSKSSNDLVLKVGATDQITFKDWYASSPTRSVTTLQVMAEAMADFTPGGADPLRDNKVEAFNFAGLVGAFDAARTATPTLTDWALTNALADFQLAGSDTAALGGDLAYQYGRNGTLAGIGVTPALDVLSNAALGTSAQVLTPLSGLQVGTQRLS
jgi:Ca2+-binding RTX toxin-like protein